MAPPQRWQNPPWWYASDLFHGVVCVVVRNAEQSAVGRQRKSLFSTRIQWSTDVDSHPGLFFDPSSFAFKQHCFNQTKVVRDCGLLWLLFGKCLLIVYGEAVVDRVSAPFSRSKLMKYGRWRSPGFVLSTLHLSHSNSTASTKRKWSEAVASSDYYSANVCCLYMVDRPSTVFRRHFLAASSMDLKATQAIANTLQTSGRSCLERFEKFAAQILIRLLHSSAWT